MNEYQAEAQAKLREVYSEVQADWNGLQRSWLQHVASPTAPAAPTHGASGGGEAADASRRLVPNAERLPNGGTLTIEAKKPPPAPPVPPALTEEQLNEHKRRLEEDLKRAEVLRLRKTRLREERRRAIRRGPH